MSAMYTQMKINSFNLVFNVITGGDAALKGTGPRNLEGTSRMTARSTCSPLESYSFACWRESIQKAPRTCKCTFLIRASRKGNRVERNKF